MNPEQQKVIDELEEQLTMKPALLHLSLKDWLTYEGMVSQLGETFLGVQLNEDSFVPLTYKTLPVIMRANEVKQLIKELIRQNAPIPDIRPPTTSGPVKPITKQEREASTPENKRKAGLIESLKTESEWWNGDQVITEKEVDANAPKTD